MKLKAIVLIFRESLNYKSGVGFFVPKLEVPFFGPSKWPLLPKMPELGPQKKALPVPVQKIRDHFYTYMQKTCDVAEMAILAKKNCGKSA